MNTHTSLLLPIQGQNLDLGLDSLYCGKWRNLSTSQSDLPRYFHILPCVKVST